MSAFGDLMKRLRRERGWTLETVAKKIGSHKGYVSGFENDKVNPPSAKIVRKLAKLFGQDEQPLLRLSAAQKVPAPVRAEFLAFATSLQSEAARAAFLKKYYDITLEDYLEFREALRSDEARGRFLKSNFGIGETEKKEASA